MMGKRAFFRTTLTLFFGVCALAVGLPSGAETLTKDEVVDLLNRAVEISNIKVSKAPSSYSTDSVSVTLDVKNVSAIKIAGIRVIAESNNVFGQRLDGYYGLQTDQDIEPGQTVNLTTVRNGRQFLKADQSKVTQKARPIHIVFSDGTELKDPTFQ